MGYPEHLRAAMMFHTVAYPKHGVTCSCMDKHIRELRKHLRPDDLDPNNIADKRYVYVIRRAVERLWRYE